MKIGLLGGSFNPAHAGHLHLSQHALKRLGLDEVWWLPSPQNPLKSGRSMADYATRTASAHTIIAPHKRLKLCEIEQQNHLQYTAETLALLTRLYSQHRFVWLMGSDNLAQFHRWKNWRNILKIMPICVFDRAPHSHGTLRSRTALAFARNRIHPPRALLSTGAKRPRWAYIFMPRHAESATRLRKTFGEKAFMQ